MVNARIVATKVIVSLVAVGTLGITGAGLAGGAVAGAASQTAVTTPSAAPSTRHGRTRPCPARQRACRIHKRNLARYTKAQARSGARIAAAKARGGKAQTAGYTKAAQFWQGAATHRSSTLDRGAVPPGQADRRRRPAQRQARDHLLSRHG